MPLGRLHEARGDARPRGMTATLPKVTTAADRTRLTELSNTTTATQVAAVVLCAYCPANTNGTFASVVPPEAGNCQARTLLAMQLARPL